MNNAVGVTKLFDLLKRNVLVGLGTDGMSSDMLSQMALRYLLHRLANRDPRVAFMERRNCYCKTTRRSANANLA